MAIGGSRCGAPARGTHQESGLNQERLYHVLQGAALFSNGCRKAVNAYRTTIKFFHDGQQQPPVQRIQAETVDLKQIQGLIRQGAADHTIRFDLGKIPDPTQKTVCNTRRPAAALGNRLNPILLAGKAQDSCRPVNDHGQLITRIELQALHNAKAIPQRRRQ